MHCEMLRHCAAPFMVALLLATAARAPVLAAADGRKPGIGRTTGLPLPRFVSLRSEPANLRVGPGQRYPIRWVLQRRGLPVEIIHEFGVWRGVRLSDGTEGWIHQRLLIRHRTLILNDGRHVLRAAPRPDGRPVAWLSGRLVGRILSCAGGAEWCRVKVKAYRGWLRRRDFWGTFEGEAISG